jgi:hypothetical protein
MLGRRWSFLVLGASMAATAGCSQILGPEVFTTTNVKGMVTLGGQSVGPGWIEFNPVDGTKGNLRTAPILPDGTYSAERVPIGRVTVALVNLHPPAQGNGVGRVPSGSFKFADSPIHRDIPTGAVTRLDFDLKDESLAYQRRRIEQDRMKNDPNE